MFFIKAFYLYLRLLFQAANGRYHRKQAGLPTNVFRSEVFKLPQVITKTQKLN